MEISRRDLLKTTATSGLVAAGLAASEGFLKPLLAQDEPAQALAQSTPASARSGEMKNIQAVGASTVGVGDVRQALPAIAV